MTPTTAVQAKQDPIYDPPSQLGRMVGREREATAIEALLLGGDNGLVTLTGTARTWLDKQTAERAAWRTPGVADVRNHIEIEP